MTLLEQSGWKKLFLLLTVFPCCRSLEVSIPQQQYEVTAGGDITLTCSFVPARPNYDLLILKWETIKDNTGDPVATFYSNLNRVDIPPDYEGRVTLEVNVAEQISTLHLTKVTIQDSRNYECSVLIPGDDEGTTSASTNLLVLVPPSKPICRIEGKVEYFHDITLTCLSEEGSPTPTYEWKSYSVENVPRPFPPKTVEKSGALSLFNISREMSGFYICTSTNQVGSAACNMTLAVLPGSSISGATVGIIAGIVLGVLFLGILIFCCCRKKNKKDKYTESSPGDMEFYDKDGPEAGKQYWDDKSDTATETKQRDVQYEDEDIDQQNKYSVGAAVRKLEDDQHSYNSGKERHDGRYADDGHHDSQRNHRDSRDHLDNQRNRHGGSRDHLGDQRNRYGGSRDHLDDQRNRYGGSRDQLDDQRNRYGGSRDHLDDQRNRYGGSRDHLDDQRNRYGGSRDHLVHQHDSYRGSREDLEDQRYRYGGSRDHLDEQRDRYRGSRDRLNDQHDRYGGSRNQLDDPRDRYRGSRDHLDYTEDEYRNRYE